MEEEAKCDLSLIDKAVHQSNVEDIKKLGEQTEQEIIAVESKSALSSEDILLDIRSPAEIEHKPLEFSQCQVETIPFYKLSSDFASLDQSKSYYLYCDRGVMSKMQALVLKEKGYGNVRVYRP